jgi:hypothetical protein
MGLVFFRNSGEWTFELNNSFTKLPIRQAATDLRVAEKVRELLSSGDGPGSKGFLGNFQRTKGFIGKFQKGSLKIPKDPWNL